MKPIFVKDSSVRGFSLTETMVVVAILGILSSVVLPRFAEQIRSSAESSTKGSLATLRSSLLLYFADNIGVDASTVSAIVPQYINAIPTAQIGKYHPDSDTYVWDAIYSLANLANFDRGGWYYISSSGQLFVNCTHTDTKGVVISAW